ncbi:MAG: excinuclease ABC subunit A [Gammaproteobacteria bacterium]|nr:MAG: excinuclease ABC subunit A [Gammaproteobacteria bacterium]
MSNAIRIQNAHQNNLRHLDLTLPHGELIVITGVSGSGKSTLAFDTIYAEGQRRYVETFSPYARQFLDRMDKPQVDRIDGIPPAIAIDQINPVRTSRSTVGTMTELNDYIKLLFARQASLYCGGCGHLVERETPEHIAEAWLARDKGRVMVSFDVAIPENFSADEITAWLARQGYTRLLEQDTMHLRIVQDRLRLDRRNRSRFVEALEAAFQHGHGLLNVHALDDEREITATTRHSARLHCEHCDIAYRDPLPSSFSFNSPIGACETCRGFGRVIGIDYRLAIPDESLSLAAGAVKVFQTKTNLVCQRDLVREAKKQGIPLDIPYGELDEAQRDWVIHGDGRDDARKHWYGVKGFFDYLEARAYKMHVRVMLARYRRYDECPACHGARLKPESLLWRIGSLDDGNAVIKPLSRYRDPANPLSDAAMAQLPGLNVADMMRLPLARLQTFVARLADDTPAVATVTGEMQSRLAYLNEVGLDYLTLDRQSRTLSGGEVQRINLTTALGTSLVNTLFVLDEPSIGLHPRDMDRIIAVLERLRDAGNSLIVVEHDPQVMLAADRIIDMGPGPGKAGGNIVFKGRPTQLLSRKRSLTAQYLNGNRELRLPERRTAIAAGDPLVLHGARGNNLDSVTLTVPVNQLVCITGPSGSGKSTLIHDTLHPALLEAFGKPGEMPKAFDSLSGHEQFGDVIMVDQSPIGKSARSNPVSYTGAFEAIRKLFAALPEARERGYRASAFSFNSGMRCPACSGNGFEHVEMQFLSDVYLRCGECQGRRYRPELLEIKWFNARDAEGQSIADVLEMTVDRALDFFADEAAVVLALTSLHDVGLGYLELGQPVPTLSGGEAQRLKLAAYLGKAAASRKKRAKTAEKPMLFLFDEPTTGLHFADIEKLLGAFSQLLDAGHSLLVVEHNLDVIASADHVIDLGPGGGEHGGRVVASGSPAELIAHGDSATAVSLRDFGDASDRLRREARSVAEAPARGRSSGKHPARHRGRRSPDSGSSAGADSAIIVHNAREHNLKSIDTAIPRNKLTVITGKSGSGKSTLAFDIVFREGQRRYLESLNAYARQFVQPASQPDVDAIHGIPPTVAIEQRTSRGGRKSTVATMTELYHFIRLLFVRLGTQYCPDCEVPISAQTVDAIAAQLQQAHRGRRVALFAPLVLGRKGYYTDLARWARGRGFDELRVDGTLTSTHQWPRLDRFIEHDIDLPTGEIEILPKNEEALRQMLQRAVDFGSGAVRVAVMSGSGKTGSSKGSGKKADSSKAGRNKAGSGNGAGSKRNTRHETLYSTTRACSSCQRSFPELDPRMFSWNSRHGWCESCFGTGELIPGFDEEQTGEERNWRTGKEDSLPCPACEGQRLKPEALAVLFKDHNIVWYTARNIAEAGATLAKLKLDERESLIARDILAEMQTRLDFLQQVGLHYLTLDRSAPSLSGGEAQRIRLAAQLGSSLEGVCYVLDEPTIGLHPRDNRQLLDTLARLRDKGNTIIVVEHDEDTMQRADHLIDMGPGAGVRGGEVVASGTLKALARSKDSITGRFLREPLRHPLHPPRARAHEQLEIIGAHRHNLRNVNVAFPLHRLVAVSGVSGSGKSTLVRDVLHDNLAIINKAGRRRSLGRIDGCESIAGWQSIDRVLEVDQTPIGKTSRSCPATYIGFWDNIRKLYAGTTEARIRGYDASRFSFNTTGGRCEECQGQGMQRIEMNFLPDVRVPCELCGGRRFNEETLSIRWREQSIGDILMMNVDNAVTFFEAHPSIHHPLKLLQDVGLGYLTLGQQSRTLSGGEAQRIKLVSELAKAKPGPLDKRGKPLAATHTLYILDEPTVGLHMADVEMLITVLQRLVDIGNSVIVIEHNLDILAEADWLVDMGPEGGDGGGRVVARGSPAKVARSKRSRTAPFIVEMLDRSTSTRPR